MIGTHVLISRDYRRESRRERHGTKDKEKKKKNRRRDSSSEGGKLAKRKKSDLSYLEELVKGGDESSLSSSRKVSAISEEMDEADELDEVRRKIKEMRQKKL
jgi:hypothetical protein